MDNMIKEKLKLVAAERERMHGVADIMDRWEKAQFIVEKSSFDCINISDKAINLSKGENELLSKLMDCYQDVSVKLDQEDQERVTTVLKEADILLHKIMDIAYEANDVSHILEREVACQREITESLVDTIGQINKSLEQAVACADFLIADF